MTSTDRVLISGFSTLLLAVLVHATALAQSAGNNTADDLDEVVVTGRFPGPPLWKVYKGDHVLWILPLVDMYPKKMQWESARVKTLIGESQEYIERPVVASGIYTANPLVLFRVLGLMNTMKNLPGKQTLADVLPPELYRRFKAVKSRHFPKSADIERMTVSTAARTMQTEVLEHENLKPLGNYAASPQLITEPAQKWMKGNKAIRRTTTGVQSGHAVTSKELKALSDATRELATTPEFQKAQIHCFESVLAYFERDLEPVKRRANAWARGRVDDLVNPTPLYDALTACTDPLTANAGFPVMKKLVAEYPGLAPPDTVEMAKRARRQWLEAADKALTNNASTFSLLAVNDVLDKDGLVEQLRARGYKVEISAADPER